MTQNTFTIRDAFAQTVLEEFAAIPSQPNEPYSIKFIKRISKLMRREGRFYFPITNTLAKRIAVAIITVLIMFGTSLSIEAVRRAVAGFFADIFDTHTNIYAADDGTNGELKDIIEEIYTLGYIPDGYELNSESYGMGLCKTEWVTTDGESMRFHQGAGKTSAIQLDTDGNLLEEISRPDFEGLYLFDKGTGYYLLWVQNGYRFHIFCSEKLPLEDMIDLAKSIKPLS